MRLLRAVALVPAVLVLGVLPAGAASFTVHDTGVNGSDVLVAPGAAASFWTLEFEPGGASEAIGSGTFRYYNPAYFADTATAAWVSMAASGNASSNGLYVYRLTFDLTNFNAATAVITGVFGTDNDGFIRLNGGANVASTCFACFGATTSFAINSGFLPGLNTIEVGVDNGGNPTAFFVQFTSATATPSSGPVAPEPASLALLGGGLSVLVARARRRRRA